MTFATRYMNHLSNALNSFNAAGCARPETGPNTTIFANLGTDTGAYRRDLMSKT